MTDAARAEPVTLRLHAMRFFGRIGHTEEERKVGTHVEVDVELVVPLESGPAHSLRRTVDYRDVHAAVESIATTGEHPLLEGLAQEILDGLDTFAWEHALVRVRKPSPPITGQMAHAEVELRRQRSKR